MKKIINFTAKILQILVIKNQCYTAALLISGRDFYMD